MSERQHPIQAFRSLQRMEIFRKKASEATLMYGLRQRVMPPRHLLRVALSSVTFAALLAFGALSPQTSAAQMARPNDTININFTVQVEAGTPPSDVLFWFCPDAKADGTGCDEMNTQTDGTFTYQLTTTTGTTYQHLTIEWSHGRLPSDAGPIPVPPAQIACDYHPFNVTADAPRSITCKTNFTAANTTPTPPVIASPTTPPDPVSTPGNGDNSTLVTGLQIIIGVGLFLFIVLLIILVWQRMSTIRRHR
jgi:hypothetical protein